MLSNAAGFLPGIKQENMRIQQIGAWSLDVNVLSKIPIASIVLLQNYGGRQIQAFSKFLRPGIITAAPKHAKLAVMGAGAIFDLFYGKEVKKLLDEKKETEARELRKKIMNEFNYKARADQDATHCGNIDFTFDNCDELRQYVIQVLDVASENAIG